ncbi:DUF945 family protein, partial [Escherichia sp. R-CC3]
MINWRTAEGSIDSAINVNLTYELDKLTKGNQQLGSGEWSLIAESIDPSAVRQFIIQYNIAMQK